MKNSPSKTARANCAVDMAWPAPVCTGLTSVVVVRLNITVANPGFPSAARWAYNLTMTKLAEEVARLVNMLPEDKAQALLEYARYLAEKADEEECERKFADPKCRPKLSALMGEVEREIAAGQSEPLDLERL